MVWVAACHAQPVSGHVLCRARTLLRKPASGEADGDLSNTPEQQLLNEHGQDLNAAISAAWKALPEDIRTQYKQRAQALKVGSAPPPEGATSAAVGHSGHAPSQAQAHTLGAVAGAANAVPAAVNIAAHLTDLGDSAALSNGPLVDRQDFEAVPGNLCSQPGGKQGHMASVPPAEHSRVHTPADVKVPDFEAKDIVSQPADMLDVGVGAGAGEAPLALQLGADAEQAAAKALNDVEGGQ